MDAVLRRCSRWWVNGSFVGATTDMDLPSLVFNDLALGLISVTDCSLELITDDCGIGGLTTNATNPIIIRSKRGTDLRVTGNVEVRSVSHVRLQGLELEGATVRFENATGCGLASCIVETSVVFENCSDPDVYNNTFDCQSGASGLELQNCGGGLVWNNIFYQNSAGNPGVTWTGGAPSLGYNCYWPNNCPWSEPGSTYGDPLLHATQYHITSGSSVAMSAGEPQFTGPTSLYEDGTSTKVYDGDVPEDAQDPLDNFSVPEGSGGRQGSLYYHDGNASQGYDTGEDVWHDLNANGVYDDGTDAKVYGGGNGYQVADQDPGEQKGLFYHDADGDGDWDAGESIYVSTSNMVGYVCADFYGRRRRTHPCQGAIERHTESVESSCGRVTARVIDGRRFEYSYDGAGRLVSYTDVSTPANSATYVYDYLGNRVKMRIGQGTSSDTSYYFVYEGLDPVAEYVDEGSDGSMDRTRIYWVLPDIDRRVGFVDLEGGNAHYYFYLTDQVGSVLQIVDENDTVVNQYDYDAFGNLVPENTFETVENRYRFQGREWDAHAGHYYFRNRTYIPEWGVWPQPDPDIRADDPNGCWNYVAFENDPQDHTDPLGLWTEAGLIEAYVEEYGDNQKAMDALVIVLSLYRLEHGDFKLDDWGVDHKAGVIRIASTWWFGSERPNANAASQLYQVLADEFFGLADLPETWGGMGRRVGGGGLKAVGGGFSTVGGSFFLLRRSQD